MDREKILYASDLDGTLLNSDQTTSEYTNRVINDLVAKGMMFSYATARSFETSHKVAGGISANIPVIVYNGTMVIDSVSGELLIKNFFGSEINSVIDELIGAKIYPIVYSFIDGRERFSYAQDRCSAGMELFVKSRWDDSRRNPVALESLKDGEMFYLTCIDDKEKLQPFFQKYKEKYHCVFHLDIYTNHQWLEIMPKSASKANAIKKLKAYLNCDKVIAFGDGKNDIDMFEIADEAYAMGNAVDELKAIATAVIDSNDNDGVATWLKANAKI